MAKLPTLTHKLPLWLFAASLIAAPACNATRLDTGEEEDGEDMGMSDYRRDLAGTDLRKPRDRDAACASVKAEATLGKKPVDIIFVIDNSGSMSDEILAVQNNINKNFTDIIGKSGLDYRVIMVTRHGKYNGTSKAVCVEKPLSTVASCTNPPTQPGINPGKFYHYSIQVESTDSFRRLLNSFGGSVKDEFNLAPMGWSQWARTDAFKVFIEITDDRSDMTAADFEKALFALPGKQFGDAMDRNYVWHSIIGLKENSPATKAWQHTDPVQTGMCTGSAVYSNGADYQNLSIATKGLRFPICQFASFDAVFNQVAMGVIAGTKVACDFPLPMPPPGQKVDLDSVTVDYTPMGMGTPTSFKQVSTLGACVPNAFYISGDRIYMCPETCADVQKDTKAKVEVLFDCLSIIG